MIKIKQDDFKTPKPSKKKEKHLKYEDVLNEYSAVNKPEKRIESILGDAFVTTRTHLVLLEWTGSKKSHVKCNLTVEFFLLSEQLTIVPLIKAFNCYIRRTEFVYDPCATYLSYLVNGNKTYSERDMTGMIADERTFVTFNHNSGLVCVTGGLGKHVASIELDIAVESGSDFSSTNFQYRMLAIPALAASAKTAISVLETVLGDCAKTPWTSFSIGPRNAVLEEAVEGATFTTFVSPAENLYVLWTNRCWYEWSSCTVKAVSSTWSVAEFPSNQNPEKTYVEFAMQLDINLKQYTEFWDCARKVWGSLKTFLSDIGDEQVPVPVAITINNKSPFPASWKRLADDNSSKCMLVWNDDSAPSLLEQTYLYRVVCDSAVEAKRDTGFSKLRRENLPNTFGFKTTEEQDIDGSILSVTPPWSNIQSNAESTAHVQPPSTRTDALILIPMTQSNAEAKLLFRLRVPDSSTLAFELPNLRICERQLFPTINTTVDADPISFISFTQKSKFATMYIAKTVAYDHKLFSALPPKRTCSSNADSLVEIPAALDQPETQTSKRHVFGEVFALLFCVLLSLMLFILSF